MIQNKNIDQMFRKAKYVFKNGDEIVKNGKILKYKKLQQLQMILNMKNQ